MTVNRFGFRPRISSGVVASWAVLDTVTGEDVALFFHRPLAKAYAEWRNGVKFSDDEGPDYSRES